MLWKEKYAQEAIIMGYYLRRLNVCVEINFFNK